MPSARLQKYLEDHHVNFLCLKHAPAYTAQGVAESAHVSGNTLTKTVVVKVDGRLAMAIVHAADRIDLNKLRESLGAKTVELAAERDFKDAFTDCELGAVPPFGNLYGMEVFLERDVPSESDIVFSAGTHSEVIALAYRDFEALVKPTTAHIT